MCVGGIFAANTYCLSMGKGTRVLCSVPELHIPSFELNLLILGFLKTDTAAKQRWGLREKARLSLLVRDQHFSLSTTLWGTLMGDRALANRSTTFLVV